MQYSMWHTNTQNNYDERETELEVGKEAPSITNIQSQSLTIQFLL